MLVQCVGYVVSELILSTFFFFCGWPVVRLSRWAVTRRTPDRTAQRETTTYAVSGWWVFCLLLLALCSQF